MTQLRRPPGLRTFCTQCGLTLIEVLVALAVVAISLTAGLQATGALTRLADRQSHQWLAQLCAENALVQLRLQSQLPAIGESTTECPQAGRVFRVQVQVSTTPNPSFRRVQAHVEHQDGADLPTGTLLLQLTTVIGRY
jgi:general secretion pathway protein I